MRRLVVLMVLGAVVAVVGCSDDVGGADGFAAAAEEVAQLVWHHAGQSARPAARNGWPCQGHPCHGLPIRVAAGQQAQTAQQAERGDAAGPQAQTKTSDAIPGSGWAPGLVEGAIRITVRRVRRNRGA